MAKSRHTHDYNERTLRCRCGQDLNQLLQRMNQDPYKPVEPDLRRTKK